MGREIKGLRVYLNDREKLLVDKVGRALGISPSKALIFGFLKYINQVVEASQLAAKQAAPTTEALDELSSLSPSHPFTEGDTEVGGLPAGGGGEPG
jgi:hypothetical protein